MSKMPKIKPARHRSPEVNSGEAGGDVNHLIEKKSQFQDTSMLVAQSSVLATQSSVLAAQSSVLAAQPSVLATQSAVLVTHSWGCLLCSKATTS